MVQAIAVVMCPATGQAVVQGVGIATLGTFGVGGQGVFVN